MMQAPFLRVQRLARGGTYDPATDKAPEPKRVDVLVGAQDTATAEGQRRRLCQVPERHLAR